MMRKYLSILFAGIFAFMLFLTPSVLHAQGNELKTVIIDPGHGGKDSGAVSKDGKTMEKNINLAVSKLLGAKIKDAFPGVNVVYTRTTDKFVELRDRVAIANRNNGNLFISIHINAAKNAPSANGFSVFTLGQYNAKGVDLFDYNETVSQRENSVIMFEDDYSTKYQDFDSNDPSSLIFFSLMHTAQLEQGLKFAAEISDQFKAGPFKKNKGIYQDNFYVLRLATMPAVLVEAGFISNLDDLKVINSETGKEKIAQNLFLAFKSFKAKYDSSLEGSYIPQQTTDPQPEASSGTSRAEVEQSPSSDSGYGIQVLLLSRQLPADDKALKGYQARSFKSGNMYKYIVYMGSDLQKVREAHGKVKQDFPDSFIVKIENGKVSRL